MNELTFNEAVTFIIVTMGAITVALSFFVALAFLGHKRRMLGDGKILTNALMWQLVGECTIGAITLVFAIAAYTNKLPDWSIGFQSFLRFTMFTATSWTTFHLWRTIEKLHGQP